jgi:hypothetical protein
VRRLNVKIHIVLLAAVMLLAAGTPSEARTAAARPTVSARAEVETKASSSWWHRFMQKLLRARYAMAAN